MDKALTCHAGGWGLDPDKTKEDFCLEKIQICAPIPLGTPPCALSLLMARSIENSELTCC